MITIRKNVFETNSSSTHSICICTKDEFDKFQDEGLYLRENSLWSYTGKNKGKLENKKFITKDEAIDILINDKYNNYSQDDLKTMSDEDFDDIAKENEINTYNSFNNNDLEYYEESYTSPSGDDIIIFGQYGYDG